MPQEETQRPLLVTHYFQKISGVRRAYKSDNDIADVAGLDPDKQ